MPSEHFLTSLGSYAALVAIPIGVAALALTNRGWDVISSTSRGARTTIRPSEGNCSRRFFFDLADGDIHVCTSIWPSECHGKPHTKGHNCWDHTALTVLNHWHPDSIGHFSKKPKQLPLGKEFIYVDYKVILAFILMTAKKEKSGRTRVHVDEIDKRTLHIAGASVDIQQVTSEVVVVHLRGNFSRNFDKDYIGRLLQGYPPLVKDPWGHSVFKTGDEGRGGWVIALGLDYDYKQEDAFLPVYLDCVLYKDRRGHVFWRSMDRVLNIIVNIWAKAFSTDPDASKDIALTIRALEYIKNHETSSGIEHLFNLTIPNQPLTDAEIRKIIAHFNGPPLAAEGSEASFRTEWAPLLRYVLVNAVDGCTRCIEYFKNEGRELEGILPMDLLKNTTLFLRGC